MDLDVTYEKRRCPKTGIAGFMVRVKTNDLMKYNLFVSFEYLNWKQITIQDYCQGHYITNRRRIEINKKKLSRRAVTVEQSTPEFILK